MSDFETKNINDPEKGLGTSINLFLPISEEIKNNAFVTFGLYSKSLNFEYYTKVYFPGVLFEINTSKNVDSHFFTEYSKTKNAFIEKEIKTINDEIFEIKNIFKYFNISANTRFLNDFLKKGELEPENKTFLKLLQEEDLELDVLGPIIKNRLAQIGALDLLYICGIIYLDLYKNHQFLTAELSPDSIEKTVLPYKEGKDLPQDLKLTALEAAYLAYYFVQSGEYQLYDHIGNEKDWKHFSEISGGASITNVRKNFKEIERYKDIRLKPSRDSKIKNALTFIESNFPDKPNVIMAAKNDLDIVQNKKFPSI
jgi:hypothetical protein